MFKKIRLFARYIQKQIKADKVRKNTLETYKNDFSNFNIYLWENLVICDS